MRVGIPIACSHCGKMKKPFGRSAALEMANSLCDSDCEGYFESPFPGDLWPGETEKEFGYPIGNHGTKIVEE